MLGFGPPAAGMLASPFKFIWPFAPSNPSISRQTNVEHGSTRHKYIWSQGSCAWVF